jgi:hypothetical protein
MRMPARDRTARVLFAFSNPPVCFTPRMLRRAALMMLLVLIWPGLSHGMGKKDDKAVVSFHIETEAADNPKMIFQQEVAGSARYFRRMPEISTKDLAVFTPFPNANGDYGVAFRLKPRAVNRLAAITAANQRRWMLANVNGRPVDAVMIDAQISDGVLVVWRGINLADIQALDATLPRAGEEGGKKKN